MAKPVRLEQDGRVQIAYREGGSSIRLPKTAEVVAETIRRDIVNGVLREGDKLPAEPILTESFRVSKPTIREAFRILESEGLIEVRRGASGARVRLPDEVASGRIVGTLLQLKGITLDDVWKARMIFEPPWAAQLAECRSDDDLSLLRQALAEQRECFPDFSAFAAKVVDFHQLVVTLARNETLAVVARLLDEVVRRHATAMAATFERTGHDGRRRKTLLEHEEFVDLVAQRLAGEAHLFWLNHLEVSARIALSYTGSHTVLDLHGDMESSAGTRLPH